MRAALLALVIACGTATAGRFPPDVSIQPPIVLRLEGTFVADREHARAGGADAVGMLLGDDRRWFSARDARTVGGDPAVSARTILNALAPYGEVMVVGDAALRSRLADAAAGAPIRVDGVIDRGSRTYLLREVLVGDPAP
jgi:hypothetical protein